VAERIAPTLAELRALLGRIEQRRLEPDDWAVVDGLLSEFIDQADPGQELVVIGRSEEEEAVDTEDAPSDCESKRGAHHGSGPQR
jgi:hypothetical protein